MAELTRLFKSHAHMIDVLISKAKLCDTGSMCWLKIKMNSFGVGFYLSPRAAATILSVDACDCMCAWVLMFPSVFVSQSTLLNLITPG